MAGEPVVVPHVEPDAPVPAPEGPPFDAAAALDRCMGDVGFLDTLLASFVKAAPGSLDEINRGLSDADAEATTRAAHSLKGAAGMITANTLREHAARVETLAHEGDLAAAADHLDQLRDEAERCVACIEAFRETSPVAK